MPTQPAQCAARSSFAGVQVHVIGTLQEAQVVVAPEHVGRRREQLEVLRPQRSHLVGPRQRLVGVHPRSPPVGLTAPFEFVDGIHHGYSDRSSGAPRPARARKEEPGRRR